MLEIVVFTIEKDRIVGYLSAPKDMGKADRAASRPRRPAVRALRVRRRDLGD